MQKQNLGKTQLNVSRLCLGGNVFGWTIDETTSHTILDAYVAQGGNFIDTADIYSNWVHGNKGGESESIIGTWLKKRQKRNDVIIATKVGVEMSPGNKGLSKKYIMQAVEASLKRLQTDYIDLYQSHEDDLETPLAETLEAYQQLIQAGKVVAIGASNYKKPRLEEALSISQSRNLPAYQSLQPFYNLYDREDYETNLQTICEKQQLGVIPYFSLASGFLSGKYRSTKDLDISPRGRSVKKYLNTRGLRILKALDEIAAHHQATPAQISLAWLMAQPTITAPIASATNLAQLQELVASVELKLTPNDLNYLTEASAYR